MRQVARSSTVLREVQAFYRRNDIDPDAWLSPLIIYPARFEDREKRKMIFQLVNQGELEENTEQFFEYRIRPKQE